MANILQRTNAFIKKYHLQYARHTAVFLVILFGFHFIYLLLINDDLIIPPLEGLYVSLRGLLVTHSAWVVEHILGYDFTVRGDALVFPGNRSLIIDESCSAVKWFAHFLVLMLIFPGPWKHKAWFIPAGLLITHLVNIVRISGLAAVYVIRPGSFDLFHDYVFRPFFYLVLFLVWVVWVEYFYLPGKKKTAPGNRG